MPRNGSGTYSLPASSWNPAVTGTTIESSAANTTLTDLASALTQSVSKDGQTTMTGNLPMGNNKLTGLGNGAISTDSIAYGQAAKLSVANTFSAAQTINGAVSISGSLTVTGPVIFSSGTITVDNLAVSSVASINVLNVTSTASVNLLTVSSVASVNVLNVSSTASVSGAITSQGVQVIPFNIPALRQDLVGVATSNAVTTFTASYLLLADSSGNPKIVTSVNVAPDFTASGVNGLDTGSGVLGDWYYFWVINNGTATTAGTTAGLISASATAPTMPAGYTYKALVSARRSNSTTSFTQIFHQVGNRIYGATGISTSSWLSQPLNGVDPGTPGTLQNLSLTAYVPPIAKTVFGVMGSTNTGAETGIAVAGNGNGGSSGAGMCVHNSDGATTTAFGGLAGASRYEVPLVTAQNITWTGYAAGANHTIYIAGFTI